MNQHQSILDEIAADAEAKTENIPGDERLGRIASLCRTLLDIQNQINTQQEFLKQLEKTSREYSDQHIPQAMAEAGVSKFTLTDGTQVHCVPFYNVSINKDNEQIALTWLRENNFGDLIRNQVAVNLGTGHDLQAQRLLDYLYNEKFAFSAKETIHPQTLKAWGKEQLEKGKALPTDLFNLFVGQTTKLTRKG